MTNNHLHIETNIRLMSRLMEDLQNGNLQIPPFQRDFVWQRDAIKDLFDSIKNSYPIGSVILWTPRSLMDWTNKSSIGAFTLPTRQDKGYYVLDGYQRLSSLFGCLTNPDKSGLKVDKVEWSRYYCLYYDLEDESFIYLRTGASPLPYQIPVYILMSSSDFRQYSRRHIEPYLSQKEIDLYLDRADRLTNKLLEYQIAVIEITNANIEESVDIFSRINSKGTDISYDWMVNALSYNKDKDFRFADVIDEIIEKLKQYHFEKIGRNNIFRCIQSSFGKLYIDQGDIEKLARRDDFIQVTKSIVPYIEKSARFLYEQLNVIESKLLPYNTQLIFIVEFFRTLQAPTEKQLGDLKKWFWITTYTNYFTVNSLANQRKAYIQFMDYLKGYSNEILYLSDPEDIGRTMDFPQTIAMGSVRAKALTLFCLNYYSDNGQSKGEKVFMEKIFRTESSSPENLLIVDNDIIGSSKKSEFLNSVFTTVEDGGVEANPRMFITENLRQLKKKKCINEFLKRRKDMIIEAEMQFVTELGLKYTGIDS